MNAPPTPTLLHYSYPTHPQGTRSLLDLIRVRQGKRHQQGMLLAASRGETTALQGRWSRVRVKALSICWLLCPSAKGLAHGALAPRTSWFAC